jgi:hypothetical protein
MSALEHFADSSRTSSEVRVVPEAAVSNRSKTVALFDHLVGAGEQLVWNLEAERLRGQGACPATLDGPLLVRG